MRQLFFFDRWLGKQEEPLLERGKLGVLGIYCPCWKLQVEKTCLLFEHVGALSGGDVDNADSAGLVVWAFCGGGRDAEPVDFVDYACERLAFAG